MKVLKIKLTKKTIAQIVFLLFIVFLTVFFWPEVRTIFTDAEKIRNYIQSFGIWGPIALIFFCIFQVIIWPIPGYLPVIIGSYQYGFWGGFLYTFIGINIGTFIVAYLSRKYGRPLVEKVISKKKLAKWDIFFENKGPVFLFLAFLTPGLPDDLLCYVVGLTKIPIILIVILSAIGRSVQNANISYFGEAISFGNLNRLIIPMLLIGLMGVAGILSEKRITTLVEKAEKRFKKFIKSLK